MADARSWRGRAPPAGECRAKDDVPGTEFTANLLCDEEVFQKTQHVRGQQSVGGWGGNLTPSSKTIIGSISSPTSALYSAFSFSRFFSFVSGLTDTHITPPHPPIHLSDPES